MATSMTQLLRQAAQSRLTGQPAAGASSLEPKAAEPAVAAPAQPATPALEASRQSEQTNPTVEPDSLNKQSRPSVELVSATQQLGSTDEQTNLADKQPRQADKPDTPIAQPKQADKASKKKGQTISADKTDDQIKQIKETDKSGSQIAPAMRLPPRLPLATAAQKTLAAHFLEAGPMVTTYAVIAAETGVPLGTARTIVDKFVAAGWLRKEQWGAGRNRALSLSPTEALADLWRGGQTDKSSIQKQHANPAYKQSVPTRQFHQTVESNRANAPLQIERKNLSISWETLRTSWPCLARTGFGLEQLEQIHSALTQLGKSTDRVVQGLDHAEWELAEGRMADKTGQPVADPCAWVFRSLASQGYYRRPVGYVSAEEQAELDAALAQSRENARQARFKVWLLGLSRQEREQALEGRKGPEETWLKNVWVGRGEPA